MTSRIEGVRRLNQLRLPNLPAGIRTPAYDRQAIPQNIIHIGVGGFHRAHQAVYLDDLLHLPAADRWGICGIGLLPQDASMCAALVPQDCLYTVLECSTAGERARVIGSLQNYLYAPGDPQAAIEKMAAPECKIVSLTITEGGYYVNQATGVFDRGHPDIVRDLQHPQEPAASFGYLAEALDRRRRRGLSAFTLMSCDNLQHNGDVMRAMFLAFADLRDPALRRWIERNVAFPNSMVDRITPVTADRHRDMLRDRFGLEDAWPVVTEPFRQWVLEDTFTMGRPALERVGVQMTSDVAPYEKMKIRLLNASHQAICHAGRLLGYEYVHEAVSDRLIQKLVRILMDEEMTSLLDAVPGIDIPQYKETLLERFCNPAIQDQLSRIGMEGSARMPKFVLPSIMEQLERRGPIRALSLTVACWFRCLQGHDDAGKPLPLVDAMHETLRDQASRGGADPRALLSIVTLFGKNLSESPRFLEEVSGALRSLCEKGARSTLKSYLD